MRPKWHTIGVVLALVAGFYEIAVTTWTMEPQGRFGPTVGVLWMLYGLAVGSGFLAAAFLSDRNPVLSRVLLVVGALVLIGSGLFFGRLPGTQGLLAAFMDLFPALLALVAALLIGPIERPGAERRARGVGSTEAASQHRRPPRRTA